MQPSPLKSTINRLPSHSHFEQLPPRNYSVLLLRKPSNRLIPRTNR